MYPKFILGHFLFYSISYSLKKMFPAVYCWGGGGSGAIIPYLGYMPGISSMQIQVCTCLPKATLNVMPIPPPSTSPHKTCPLWF